MVSIIDPLLLPLLKTREIEDLLILDMFLTDGDENSHAFYNGEHLKYGKMTLENFNKLTDEECKSRFRFFKADVLRLIRLLRIPPVMRATNRTRWTDLEGICIILRRLNYPKRLDDMVPEFGRHPSDLSIICNQMVHLIHDAWGHLLDTFQQDWLSQQNLRAYAAAVYDKGCPLKNCFGFIDGTLIACCRPKHHQRAIFNGKDRVHGLKYQAITMPNGLIGNLYGPVEGAKHDSTLLRESRVLDTIATFTAADNSPLVIYGDKAYPIHTNLITPYRGVGLGAAENDFNLNMNSARISVEWGFGMVGSEFAFVQYPKNMKLYLQPIGLYYKVAALLTNCHTCLYGSVISSHFDVEPPQLENYLH